MDIQEMQEPTSLKQLFQSMVPEAMEIITGKVISASPLKIQATNDDKLVLHEGIVCIPKHLSTYQTTVDIALGSGGINSATGAGQGTHSHSGGTHSGHEGGDGSHSHSDDGDHTHSLVTFNITGATMTVYNGLKVGDTVYILSFNHGKKYFIIDREA